MSHLQERRDTPGLFACCFGGGQPRPGLHSEIPNGQPTVLSLKRTEAEPEILHTKGSATEQLKPQIEYKPQRSDKKVAFVQSYSAPKLNTDNQEDIPSMLAMPSQNQLPFSTITHELPLITEIQEPDFSKVKKNLAVLDLDMTSIKLVQVRDDHIGPNFIAVRKFFMPSVQMVQLESTSQVVIHS